MITKETAMTKTTRKSTPKSRAAFVAKLRALCAKHNVHLSGDLDGNVVAYFMEGKDICDPTTPYRVVA